MSAPTGNNLTHENIMRVTANIKAMQADMLLPGSEISTSLNDFAPVKSIQFRKLVGERWQAFGPIVEPVAAPSKEAGGKAGHAANRPDMVSD